MLYELRAPLPALEKLHLCLNDQVLTRADYLQDAPKLRHLHLDGATFPMFPEQNRMSSLTHLALWEMPHSDNIVNILRGCAASLTHLVIDMDVLNGSNRQLPIVLENLESLVCLSPPPDFSFISVPRLRTFGIELSVIRDIRPFLRQIAPTVTQLLLSEVDTTEDCKLDEDNDEEEETDEEYFGDITLDDIYEPDDEDDVSPYAERVAILAELARVDTVVFIPFGLTPYAIDNRFFKDLATHSPPIWQKLNTVLFEKRGCLFNGDGDGIVDFMRSRITAGDPVVPLTRMDLHGVRHMNWLTKTVDSLLRRN